MSDADERFEGYVRREARRYNEPPETVPRDEMWSAIVVRRRTASGIGAILGGVTPTRAGRWRFGGLYAWVGMAATLLIGVAIGRFALRRGAEVPSATVAAAAVDRPVSPPSESPAAPGGAAAQARAGRETRPAASIDAARAIGQPASRTRSRGRTGEPDAATSAYVVATEEHLSRAEALLTAYGSARSDAVMDAQLARWARDLLSNTRLLLDSPAARDPSRRMLLQDLELVLVQMVQRAPVDGLREERAHIDRSLERTHVLTRLRAALPAGRNSGS